MFSNESPFFTISKNLQGNNMTFHNDLSNSLKESNSDFFSIEDNNKQFRTKGRFGFYNNGTPSQVKQYLDYFLKESDGKINLICYTGDNFHSNFYKNENGTPKKMQNSISKDFNIQQKSSINSNLNNNFKSMNNEIIENDGECPAPLCKKSFNSNISGSTFSSSYNNNSINNLCNEKIEDNFNNLVNKLGKMKINETMIADKKLMTNRKMITHKKMITENKGKFNPYMSGRVLKLNIGY